jgi:2-succinyl-5-enolpyruvyl-6-hydroxy-3-cyclohexene-1-carboxylate synthase
VDAANRNTALASALVEELALAGVEHACVSPGSRSAPLALAFWNEARIRVWSHVDERCAGFFALGLAQQSGRPVAVVTTSGTAAANLHPAVAEAGEARVPLVVITADRPPELRGRGAGQTIDQLALFGSAVRWFFELGSVDASDAALLHFRSAASRAVAEALGAPPGPVHLNVPLREPLAPAELEGDVGAQSELAREGRGAAPLTAVEKGALAPTATMVDRLASAIADCERGLVIAGRQPDGTIAAPVAALARAAGYPILAEPTSQLRAGAHDRSLVVAAYDAILRRPPERLRPELVIRIGDMVTSKATREWLSADQGCRQLVVDPDGAWNEPTSIAERMLRVDPGELCRTLTEVVSPRGESGWTRVWLDAAAAADAAIDDFLDSLGDELFEPRVHRGLAEVLPGESTVYVASSMPIRDCETFYPSSERAVRFLANRGANGIDGLVSSGLGVAATAPGRTFVVLGDLALYHDMNGLLAVKRLGVEATFVVMNNGGGAIFDFLPIAAHRDGYEELFATPTGLDLEKVAALYDLDFVRPTSHAELDGALAGPGLVEIPLDRARNVELHRALFERVADAVAAGEVAGSGSPNGPARNTEIVERVFDAFGSRDLETMLALCDPEFEWHPGMAQSVEARGFRGHSGMRAYFRDLVETWEELRMDIEALHERGDRVAVVFVARGRGRGSGAPVEQRSGVVLQIENSRLVFGRVFMDPADALRELEDPGGDPD